MTMETHAGKPKFIGAINLSVVNRSNSGSTQGADSGGGGGGGLTTTLLSTTNFFFSTNF